MNTSYPKGQSPETHLKQQPFSTHAGLLNKLFSSLSKVIHNNTLNPSLNYGLYDGINGKIYITFYFFENIIKSDINNV